MYAITGVTGNVGGTAAKYLLQKGHSVRAVLRDPRKAGPWRALGAQIAIADFEDAAALTAAFADTEGVFVMVPPNFAPDANYSGAHTVANALATAITATLPQRVVALSSIGSQQSSGLGLITQNRILELALQAVSVPTAIVRGAWFMDNSLWDIAAARAIGELTSFLQPSDKPFPMVATTDIGRVIADLIIEPWQGRRTIEIEGPQRYTQSQIAALLSAKLGRTVVARAKPRGEWREYFIGQGTLEPAPRIEMLDGFNSGWIDFEYGGNEYIRGTTSYAALLDNLIAVD
jgi:uncharacterized protein YbjT (DUF2867 family)